MDITTQPLLDIASRVENFLQMRAKRKDIVSVVSGRKIGQTKESRAKM